MKDDILRDKGLEQISVPANLTGTLKVAICRGEPTTLEHATNAEGNLTGKRVTDAYVPPSAQVVLGVRGAGGREVTITAATSAANATTNTLITDDLWYAVYDDATLYQTLDESSNKALNNGDPVDFGQLKIGFGNDA
ncbi:MAG: hypothetical protein COA86_02850 [Kangiella sp.]|nr:MAG: hypothetical protein COA86_02850 [Kangiella sp.]